MTSPTPLPLDLDELERVADAALVQDRPLLFDAPDDDEHDAECGLWCAPEEDEPLPTREREG